MKLSRKGIVSVISTTITVIGSIVVAFIYSCNSKETINKKINDSKIHINIGEQNNSPIIINSNNHNSKINSDNSR